MKKVHLSDKNGNVKEFYAGFSFPFLIFGPIYLFFRFRIFLSLFLFCVYYYFLPLPGIEYISNFITSGFKESTAATLKYLIEFFRGPYAKIFGIIIVVFLQILISFFINGILLKRIIKRKKLLPITEEDARLLISIHACKPDIKLASQTIQKDLSFDGEIYYQGKIDVPYIVDEHDKNEVTSYKLREKRKQINDLNKLYALGQMTREEYELRRAQIIKNFK